MTSKVRFHLASGREMEVDLDDRFEEIDDVVDHLNPSGEPRTVIFGDAAVFNKAVLGLELL